MAIEDRTNGTSGASKARPGGDPLHMSEAEKRMAEWEARHDVAARGRAPARDAVQHYLAHERLVHERLATGQRPPAGREAGTAARSDTEPAPAAPGAALPEEKPRGFLRRLFRRHG